MKATSKRREKSEAELLDHATGNLLRALKRDMLKKEGRVDRESCAGTVIANDCSDCLRACDLARASICFVNKFLAHMQR